MDVFTAYADGMEAPHPARLNDHAQVFGSLKLPDGYLRSGDEVDPHELRSRLAVAIPVCETLLTPIRAERPASGEAPPLDQRVVESRERERMWAFLNDYRRMLAVVEWAIARGGVLVLR